jgi:hypothetical protein
MKLVNEITFDQADILLMIKNRIADLGYNIEGELKLTITDSVSRNSSDRLSTPCDAKIESVFAKIKPTSPKPLGARG